MEFITCSKIVKACEEQFNIYRKIL